MLKFIHTNCKLLWKSSQIAHVKELMMFDDSLTEYDTTNDVFHLMSSYTTTLSWDVIDLGLKRSLLNQTL